MKKEPLYLFVDYDGVIRTFIEWNHYNNLEKSGPFNHNAMTLLSKIAEDSGRDTYFMPITGNPDISDKPLLQKIFHQKYGINNLKLHPDEPILPRRAERCDYVQECIRKYQIKNYLVLDDEDCGYSKRQMNYIKTDTYNGILFEHFIKMDDYIKKINQEEQLTAAILNKNTSHAR